MKFAELEQIDRAQVLVSTAIWFMDSRPEGDPDREKVEAMLVTASDILKDIVETAETDDA